MLLDMIQTAKTNGLAEDMIARLVKLDIDSVRKVINKEPIDMPLHILAMDAEI